MCQMSFAHFLKIWSSDFWDWVSSCLKRLSLSLYWDTEDSCLSCLSAETAESDWNLLRRDDLIWVSKHWETRSQWSL